MVDIVTDSAASRYAVDAAHRHLQYTPPGDEGGLIRSGILTPERSEMVYADTVEEVSPNK